MLQRSAHVMVVFASCTFLFAQYNQSASAQTVTCTTADGISFTTTASDRYDPAEIVCSAAMSHIGTESDTAQVGSVAVYADQLMLYNGQQSLILAPNAPYSAPQPVRATKTILTTRGEPLVLPYHDLMLDVGATYKIDPLLLHAIARTESAYNNLAVSHAGARGLMQLMPATARRFSRFSAVDALHEPYTNVSISAAYLKNLQSRFGNNLSLILAAYNAGEGAVEKYGYRIPPYRETQGYVEKVLRELKQLRLQSERNSF